MLDITNKNIILFGCGAVQKCVLHFIEKFFIFDASKMLILDLLDYKNYPDVKKYLDKGAKYHICDINKHYVEIITNLNKNDLIIDLTSRTNSLKIAEECIKNNIHYINTSLEDIDNVNTIKSKEEDLKTTYTYSHNVINTLKNKYKENATQCLVSGMNPGLITIFTKLAIIFLAKSVQKKEKSQQLQLSINERDYAKLCELLQIEVIHCSEDDTSDLKINEKITNTWCISGCIDEYSDDCQFTWGTSQKTMPKYAEMLSDHVINMNEPTYNFYCESYVPEVGKIIGVCIPHSESISGGDYFSTANFCPTIHYVYRIAPCMWKSLQTMQKKYIGGDVPENKTHVLNNYNDNFNGIDRVGALLLSSKYPTVWCGSILSNDTKNCGLNSGTTAQVAVAVLAFISWIVENPNKGAIFPEYVDEIYIYNKVKNYVNIWIGFCKYKPDSLQFSKLKKTKKQFDDYYKNL